MNREKKMHPQSIKSWYLVWGNFDVRWSELEVFDRFICANKVRDLLLEQKKMYTAWHSLLHTDKYFTDKLSCVSVSVVPGEMFN